jgi:mRNA-degrading endonuclease RelE of RelBE toxin-antitoxin system
MTNKIYIPNELTDELQRLPKPQARALVRTIDRLVEHVIEDSYLVAPGDETSGEFREARAGDLRVLFRYVPGPIRSALLKESNEYFIDSAPGGVGATKPEKLTP